ncbi:MAG: hypothetical protein Q8Q94_04405 [bacterium]|nr:hypothetical protein [bacterium]MDZ4300000.1 hypothetical protein [Candidatus Sungbacteria bacterium]
MPEDTTPKPLVPMTPQDEVRFLERMLEEKKRALTVAPSAEGEHELNGQSRGGEQQPHEREVFRDVMREHMEAVPALLAPHELMAPPPPPPLVPPFVPQAPSGGKQTDDDVAREEKLRALVETAMTSSIEKAVQQAAQQSPHLMDALHDRLTTVYYDKLLQLRKVAPL